MKVLEENRILRDDMLFEEYNQAKRLDLQQKVLHKYENIEENTQNQEMMENIGYFHKEIKKEKNDIKNLKKDCFDLNKEINQD